MKMRNRVISAVSAIAADVSARLAHQSDAHSNAVLWQELTTCILSSQIRYETAVGFSDQIARDGALLTWDGMAEELESHLYEILRSGVRMGGKVVRYRFPAAKARQLASAWSVVRASGSLRELVCSLPAGQDGREWLVKNISGFGPKQASMFLRNLGVNHDLAVIDRHVLKYMQIVGLPKVSPASLGTLTGYRIGEHALRRHAKRFECPLGVLDWAIWIVMRMIMNPHKSRTISL